MTFDPTQHGFIKLDFTFPGDVAVYELALENIDQTTHDTMRLNSYLSQDGDFVNVWFGLIDAGMTEISLGFSDDPRIDFREQYEEPLFRGYIPDADTGAVILKALRLDRKAPNILTVTDAGQLECQLLKGE